MSNLLLFGGTFDPVHIGHLGTAMNVQNEFHFDRVIFLPCKLPVLKDSAVATPLQRIQMLRLALNNQGSAFSLDLSEIRRNSPSYTAVTLENFRHQWGTRVAITVLMGFDTFLTLPQWHNWQQVLRLSNLLILDRPGIKKNLPPLLKTLLTQHETHEAQAILTHPQGLIYRYNAGNFDISSTWIREKIANGADLKPFLPKGVWQYIKKKQLYGIG